MNIKDVKLAEMTKSKLVEMIPNFDESDYNYIFSNPKQFEEFNGFIGIVVEALEKKNPEHLKKVANGDFWKEASGVKLNSYWASWLAGRPVGEQIFSNENLNEFVGNPDFRKNIFPKLTEQQKLQFVESMFEAGIKQENVDVLSDVLPKIYGEIGPKCSKVDNTVFKGPSGKSAYLAESVSDFINSEKNTVSISKYLSDPNNRNMFLNNFGLLSGLSIEDRNTLFQSVDMNNLSEEEMQNVTKLLYNGFLTNFDESLFLNKQFLSTLMKNTSLTDFRQIMNTLKFSNPEVCRDLVAVKDRLLDGMLFNDGKINKDNYPKVQYKNGEFDSYWNLFTYRYFKTCPQDLYTSCRVIQDARKSLDVDNRLTVEGQELLDAMAKVLDSRDSNDLYDFSVDRIHEHKDMAIISEIKQKADAYIQKNGELKLDGLIDYCKDAFAENIDKNLTNKNSEGVKQKIVNGVPVYDITACENMQLLIHATPSPSVPELVSGKEPLVSMSVLDNNNLTTYNPTSGAYICGYDRLPTDALLHAFHYDCHTEMSVSAELLMYLKVSSMAPVYTDLDSFMNATSWGPYNELKVRATANATNKDGKNIMKPSYLLCEVGDDENIPEDKIKFAQEHGIDIFVINPEKVKRKQYAPIVEISKYGKEFVETNYV